MTGPPTTVLLTEGNLATGPGLLGGIGGRRTTILGELVGDAVNTGGETLPLGTTFGERAADLPAVMRACGEVGGVTNLLAGGLSGEEDARKIGGDLRVVACCCLLGVFKVGAGKTGGDSRFFLGVGFGGVLDIALFSVSADGPLLGEGFFFCGEPRGVLLLLLFLDFLSSACKT